MVVAERTVHVWVVKRSVQQHNGDLCRDVLDILILLRRSSDKVGTHQNDAVDLFGENQMQVILPDIQIVPGAAQKRLISVGLQLLLQIIDCLCQK